MATRGSVLARWQAERVAEHLRGAREDVDVELVVVETTGDRRKDVPIPQLGGQGVFVKEVQAAVLDGRADVAVHSAKDLPSLPTAGLTLAAFPERGDPRDALVGARLRDLAPGATVATGSVRRQAQLAALRPDLVFTSLRGNIATRLQRIPAGGAVLVAAAALERLGVRDLAVDVLDVDVMLPQVGQGALAVECRAGDDAVLALLDSVDDPGVRTAVETERAFLAGLGGGCDVPAAAYAVLGPGGAVHVEGLLAALDGSSVVRGRRDGVAADRKALGASLAAELVERAASAGLTGVLRR